MSANGKRKNGARASARRQTGRSAPGHRRPARDAWHRRCLQWGHAGPATARSGATGGAVADTTAPRTEAIPWQFARIDVLLIALFIVGGFVLYMARIEDPPKYSYDEVYHAYTAAQYAIGNADAWLWSTQAPIQGVAYEWTHPPLGKLIMTLGILIWGDTPLGWRFMSAVFGALGLGAVYLLGLRLTGQRLIAFVAATPDPRRRSLLRRVAHRRDRHLRHRLHGLRLHRLLRLHDRPARARADAPAPARLLHGSRHRHQVERGLPGGA